MSLTTKLAILATLIGLQIVGHGYVAFKLATKYHLSSTTAIFIHFVTFCYFTTKLIMVLQVPKPKPNPNHYFTTKIIN